MKSKLSFRVNIHKRSTHWVQVHVWPTRAVMRGILTKVGHKSNNTEACCWQANKTAVDGCVAEIHFYRGGLTLETIVHESQHAAYHRACQIGVPKDDPSFQEYVSEDTGVISEGIVAFLDNRKIRVGYRAIPGRTINQ